MDEFLQYIMPYSYEILRHKLMKHYIKFTKLLNYYRSAKFTNFYDTLHHIPMKYYTFTQNFIFIYK